jgi:hypothetical protein
VTTEEKGERAEFPSKRISEHADTFRVITIDGGKILDAKLPMPRSVVVCNCGDHESFSVHTTSTTILPTSLLLLI